MLVPLGCLMFDAVPPHLGATAQAHDAFREMRDTMQCLRCGDDNVGEAPVCRCGWPTAANQSPVTNWNLWWPPRWWPLRNLRSLAFCQLLQLVGCLGFFLSATSLLNQSN